MLSRHLCSIGTCWFFVISGYFFLRFLKEEEFGTRWVLAKWKKRIRTLLIPYLIWNAIAVLAVLAKNEIFGLLNLGKDYGELQTLSFGPLSWFFFGPADFPLWFMRDLMILSLLAPLMYIVFKKIPYISLSLLVIAYLSPLDPSIPTMRSIFFFSLGAWLGTMRLNMIDLCRKVKIPAIIAAIVLMLVATSQIGRPTHLLLLRLFYPFGMIVFMIFCDWMIRNEAVKNKLCDLAVTVFFIYAAHLIYILGWTKGLFLRIFGDSLAGTWISYLGVPVVVIIVCLILYYLFDKITPKALAIACGGRTQTKEK